MPAWIGGDGSEGVIRAPIRLGDLLIRAKLVSPDDVAAALRLQAEQGGRLGDHLVSMGVISQQTLDAFLRRTPAEPETLKATGVEPSELLGLMMKLIYARRLESGRQFADAIKLPFHLVLELVRMAIDRKLLYTRGRGDNSADLNYGFTETGERYAADALQRSKYAGPAPVSLADFTDQVNVQKITNEVVSFEQVKEHMSHLEMDERYIEQCGPALNSGRAMLLYGPPGNGKTTFALRLAKVFSDMIYMPHAIVVEGQIIRVYDPSLHLPVEQAPAKPTTDAFAGFGAKESYDARWVPCRRPFVVAGGELTLEMLDLRYDRNSNFYEAPLHMKALGGCFVIDDFGRQMITPAVLLNRWIVPLESRIDYLKLHTGKSFSIPFEELVMFSTNLEPEDLMDAAFLRRLPYKIEIGKPSVAVYKRIFAGACAKHGITLSDELFDEIVRRIQQDKGMDLAAYQPGFILDQVMASCRFMGRPPDLELRFVELAINNLRVKQAN